MAYNGISPYLYKNSVSTVDIFDDISGSFNGVTTTFNITVGGASYTRFTAKACLIILGGIVQEAGVDYTVNAGQITFTTAPVSGLTFEGRHLFGLNGVDTPTSGSVAPASLSTGGPSWDTSGNVTLTGQLRGPSNFIIDPSVVGDDTGTVEIKGNLTVQGTTTTINSTTLTIDDKNIVVADGISTLENLDTSGINFGSTAVRLRYNYNGGTNSGLSIEGTNVGIGTTAPLSAANGTSLQLGGGNFAILNLSTSNSSANGKNWRIISRWTGAAAGPVLDIQTLSDDGASESTAVRITRSSNSVDNLQLWTSSTPRLYINSSGNIGIGTTNPVKLLDVRGEATFGAGITINDLSWAKDTNQLVYTFSGTAGGGNPSDGVIALVSPNANPSATRIGSLVYGNKVSGTAVTGNPGLKAGIECVTNTNVANAADTGAYMNFYTKPDNGNFRSQMNLNSNGVLTKPYQPAFLAYRNSALSVSATWQLISNGILTESYDVGSVYSTSTNGRFVAPVAGKYMFYAGGWSVANSNGERYAFGVKVNNGGSPDFITGGNYCITDSPLAPFQIVLNLAANDYVELFFFSAVSTSIGGTAHVLYWGGYLLG